MTSMIRFSPTTEARRLQRDLDTVFNEFFAPARRDHDANWTPRVDVHEDEQGYTFHVDVPGMHKENFQVDFHEGTLTVSGERRQEEKAEGANAIRVERSYGAFYRSFALPKAVEHDAIEATYTDGVLTVRVPKAEESKPRRIAVG